MAAKELNSQLDAIMSEQEAALQDAENGTYTHHFKAPFTYDGVKYETLSFDFLDLTGEDTISAEAVLRSRGITVVLPAVMPEYLAIICARACTYRDEAGNRTVNEKTIRTMPVRDFQTITGKARRFLLSAG